MDRMRPCPFCGSKPELSGGTEEYYYRRKETDKPWRRFLREESCSPTRIARGIITSYFVYAVTEYKVRCTGKRCVARSGCIYHSEEEAINAWNGGAEHEHS